MLAFLAGELTNSAYYFSTFANVHKDNANVHSSCYNTGKRTDWMPFTYQKGLNDAKLVEQGKETQQRILGHLNVDRNLSYLWRFI